MNLADINNELRDKSPQEIIAWALEVAKKPILTTNFRPLEATILHAVTVQASEIPVVWCDSGYNTRKTYESAERTIGQLNLNIDLYVPKQSVAHRNVTLGIPEVDSPEHQYFTFQVKLEPFKRAMECHQPDVWFTNLRKGQTALRSSLDIVSQTSGGMLKVCPFFYWTDPQLEAYIKSNDLESEDEYYDPTKALENRECGLHT
ncbi:MAG: phosphoadenosine phosphosulfate reductase family protein [Crocinitomicaceae bacterium]|nr:phosphoadenosine phosphosulfate reductase family protein [Crocinitomicaceae bacterium]